MPGQKKSLQKVFYFTSLKNKLLFESMINDETEVTGRSATSLTEQHVIESMTSSNTKAAWWIENLYSTDPDGKIISSIGHVMKSIFDSFSAGVDFKAAYPNGKPFVEYAMQMNLKTQNSNKDAFDHDKFYYLWSQIDSLYSYLKRYENATIIESHEDAQVDAALKMDISTLEHILSQKKESDDMSHTFHEIYQIILGNWDNKGIDNWTYTYRLLSVMADMQTWENNPKNRLLLREIIRNFGRSLEAKNSND